MIENSVLRIPIGGTNFLNGVLDVPLGAQGLVLIAHSSGPKSPRYRFVAKELKELGLATLAFDLLNPEEEKIDERTLQFTANIPFLSDRLLAVARWAKQQKVTSSFKMGCFSAGVGTAAAFNAAGCEPTFLKAIVSRSGRPDMATAVLGKVKSPTLLIVGEWDDVVLDLNRRAKLALLCESRLEIIPQATRLFEESGASEKVAKLTAEWFSSYLY